MDQLDRCCLEQDKCYGRGIRHCPDVWKKPYSRMYAWTLLEGRLLCGEYRVYFSSYDLGVVCMCLRESEIDRGIKGKKQNIHLPGKQGRKMRKLTVA